ncbi:MAG: hypothetical protein C4589_11755 [Peptococcaceae bacterium]|jgi:hypothetical protein|nr:MAG: hypothetical protein C4589_11755 [Peptococcaceae bacterium]
MTVQAVYTFIGLGWFFLAFFGVVYGILIYFRPFPNHMTSFSVVIGVAITEIFIAFTTLTILVFYGLFNLWWLPLIPLGAYITTGLPQIVVEWLKYHRQRQMNAEIEKVMADNGL